MPVPPVLVPSAPATPFVPDTPYVPPVPPAPSLAGHYDVDVVGIDAAALRQEAGRPAGPSSTVTTVTGIAVIAVGAISTIAAHAAARKIKCGAGADQNRGAGPGDYLRRTAGTVTAIASTATVNPATEIIIAVTTIAAGAIAAQDKGGAADIDGATSARNFNPRRATGTVTAATAISCDRIGKAGYPASAISCHRSLIENDGHIIDEHLCRPASRIAAIPTDGSASARPTDRICRDGIAWSAEDQIDSD